MELQVFRDYEALCDAVAQRVVAQLRDRPSSVLVFPTGNTPLGLFRKLVRLQTQKLVDFANAEIVLLDDYADIAGGDPRLLKGWLQRELLQPLAITRFHDFAQGADGMEKKLRSLSGVDLMILGLGANGHLGFNEPGSAFDSRTREVDLAAETIRSNAAYWGSEELVPKRGITMGLGTIAESKSVIIMVSGASKAGILHQTIAATPSPDIPATCLRDHPATMLMVDEAAIRR